MKYLILILSLVLVACSEDRSEYIDKLEDMHLTLQKNYESCQTQLETYRTNGQSGGFNNYEDTTPSQPTQPSEPEYEEVSIYEVDGTSCTSTDDDRQDGSNQRDSVPACGRSFWNCKDSAIRECMVNVKYKIKTEKRLVQEDQ